MDITRPEGLLGCCDLYQHQHSVPRYTYSIVYLVIPSHVVLIRLHIVPILFLQTWMRSKNNMEDNAGTVEHVEDEKYHRCSKKRSLRGKTSKIANTYPPENR